MKIIVRILEANKAASLLTPEFVTEQDEITYVFLKSLLANLGLNKGFLS